MLVPRIIITEPRPERNKLFSKKDRPDVILIIFDTAEIDRLNAKNHPERYGLRPYYVPAKYALHIHRDWDDSELVSQAYACSNEFLHQAIWFNDFYDLAAALEELKKMFPNDVVADQVDYVSDWPLRSRNFKHASGESIVIPQSPVLTQIEYGDEDD